MQPHVEKINRQQHTHIPLPNHDIIPRGLGLALSPFTTCSVPTTEIQYRSDTSQAIQKRVDNHKLFFNIIESTHITNTNTNAIVTQETYNPSTILLITDFIAPNKDADADAGRMTSKNIMFHILDAFLFYINAIRILNESRIFPIIFDQTNASIHRWNKIPCVTNLTWCLTDNPHFESDITTHLPHIPYSGVMSPEIFVLKYIHDNNIHTISPTTMDTIMSLFKSHSKTIFPASVSKVIIENTRTYLNKYYLHLSRTNAIKYTSENISSSAKYSVVALYIKTIADFFDPSNDIVHSVFIAPVMKFLTHDKIFAIHDIYNTLHTIFYVESVKRTNLFDIIQVAYK